MRFSFAIVVILPILAHGSSIIMSNGDGWAEINLRTFYHALKRAGHSPIVSAPAENKSDSGSFDEAAKVVERGCQHNSCPAGSPAIGFNISDPRLNYVNSHPVTAMAYGISTLSPRLSPAFFRGPPDLAVSGPNVGATLGRQVLFSGTVGAAVEAMVKDVPAIAFSGQSGRPTAWTAPTPAYSAIYAKLATKITTTLLNSVTPYLPKGIWLNVNFPASSSTSCSDVGDFKFVLSRIFPAEPIQTPDVWTCGKNHLPVERIVVGHSGCYASISAGTVDKVDADAEAQDKVLKKLSSILSCLPEDEES